MLRMLKHSLDTSAFHRLIFRASVEMKVSPSLQGETESI